MPGETLSSHKSSGRLVHEALIDHGEPDLAALLRDFLAASAAADRPGGAGRP